MNTELTDAQRADIRQMARDVMADKDGMAEIDRDLIGYSKVRIDLPLRDTRMMAKHLELLAAAAACYAAPFRVFREVERAGRNYEIFHTFIDGWPWADEWWKPKDRRADLVRAGALILAEIDRIDRIRFPIP